MPELTLRFLVWGLQSGQYRGLYIYIWVMYRLCAGSLRLIIGLIYL